MIFVGGSAFCQKNQTGFLINTGIKGQWNNYSSIKFNKYYSSQIKNTDGFNKSALYVNLLPVDYYSTQLGFFCKQEIKMEKITKVPFKFRLGSVQQCDWLEGKRYAINNR